MIYRTPAELAKDARIGINKVLDWIRKGELRAVNVAANAEGQRPRWRVAESDWEDFQLRRSTSPTPTPRPSRRRRRETDASVIEFF
jgi:hypothetical protein